MTIPLYKGADAIKQLPKSGHAGLWYDKFCNLWVSKQEATVWELSDRKNNYKLDWIKSVTFAVTNFSLGDDSWLKYYALRIHEMALAHGGETISLISENRFVTGLGRSHPVENGFAWHPILGVPYLPGSSIKGMVKAWASAWIEVKKDELNRIFGSDEPTKVGSVVFFDAFPIKPVKLAADIMTSHYEPYYSEKVSDPAVNPPADWYSPIPVPFLTMLPGQCFLFSIAAKPGHRNSKDVSLAMSWLKQALEWIGAGAKTSVGYGRFIENVNSQKEWQTILDDYEKERKAQILKEEKEKALAQMSPIRREMEEDGYSKGENFFMTALTSKWKKKLEEQFCKEAEKREIAGYLQEWYIRYKPDQWKKPNPKNKDKIALIKKYLNS